MEKNGGYEKINKDLLAAIREIDLAGTAKDLELSYNEHGLVEIEFLGRNYFIGSGTIQSVDGLEPGLHHGSVIAGYLLKKGCGKPAGSYVPLNRMTGMVAGRNSYNKDIVEKQLLAAVDQNSTGLLNAILGFGGQAGGEVSDDGRSWIIELLPNIPVQLIFYEADEEFPTDIRLLFDITATNYLEFEFLAVLSYIFLEALLVRAISPTDFD